LKEKGIIYPNLEELFSPPDLQAELVQNASKEDIA
jgi:hypothetical protein